MSKVFIAYKSDITEGQAKGFDPLNQGRDSLFIVHKNGEYYGYKDICPHYGDTTLPWKKDKYLDSKSDQIVCAAHGALFEIRTGICTQGPCKNQALTNIELDIHQHNEIWVDITTIKEF